jgi:hypothetical protein
MVDEEHLEALDFMLWMSGSHRAASITYTNQSTVIRRAHAVLSIFGGEMERSLGGWRIRGATDLLRMERRIHQRFRFRGRRPLRLHSPFWSTAAPWHPATDGWIFNPPHEAYVCENPVELLNERIIDACLLTPTQLAQITAAQAAELVMIPMYRSGIDFVVWPACDSSEPSTPSPRFAARRDPGAGSCAIQLHLFPFLPQSCRTTSVQWFEQMWQTDPEILLASGVNGGAGYRAAFLTPEMQRPLRLPVMLERSSLFPYTETLAFLAEHATEPRLNQLIDVLVDHFAYPPFRTRCDAGCDQIVELPA